MIIIIRTGPPYYNLILDKLEKQTPKQYVFRFDKGVPAEEVASKVEYSPIFGKYYLILLEYTKGSAFWKMLKNIAVKKYIHTVIFCKSSEDYITAVTLSSQHKLETVHYDSYKASILDKNRYIAMKLTEFNPDIQLTSGVITTIRKRLFGYATEINGFLQQLAWMTPLTQKIIHKVIPKKETLTSTTFGRQLFLGKLELYKFDALVLRYRYYPKALLVSLETYMKRLMKCYLPYIEGKYTEANHTEFLADHGKDYGLTSEFIAKEILFIYSRFSYEKLSAINAKLAEAGNNKSEDILILYTLIRIITLGG